MVPTLANWDGAPNDIEDVPGVEGPVLLRIFAPNSFLPAGKQRSSILLVYDNNVTNLCIWVANAL